MPCLPPPPPRLGRLVLVRVNVAVAPDPLPLLLGDLLVVLQSLDVRGRLAARPPAARDARQPLLEEGGVDTRLGPLLKERDVEHLAPLGPRRLPRLDAAHHDPPGGHGGHALGGLVPAFLVKGGHVEVGHLAQRGLRGHRGHLGLHGPHAGPRELLPVAEVHVEDVVHPALRGDALHLSTVPRVVAGELAQALLPGPEAVGGRPGGGEPRELRAELLHLGRVALQVARAPAQDLGHAHLHHLARGVLRLRHRGGGGGHGGGVVPLPQLELLPLGRLLRGLQLGAIHRHRGVEPPVQLPEPRLEELRGEVDTLPARLDQPERADEGPHLVDRLHLDLAVPLEHEAAHQRDGRLRVDGVLAGGRAHAREREGYGGRLLDDVDLEAVPAEHVLTERGVLAVALEEGQELARLGARALGDVVDVVHRRVLGAVEPLLPLLGLLLRGQERFVVQAALLLAAVPHHAHEAPHHQHLRHVLLHRHAALALLLDVHAATGHQALAPVACDLAVVLHVHRHLGAHEARAEELLGLERVRLGLHLPPGVAHAGRADGGEGHAALHPVGAEHHQQVPAHDLDHRPDKLVAHDGDAVSGGRHVVLPEADASLLGLPLGIAQLLGAGLVHHSRAPLHHLGQALLEQLLPEVHGLPVLGVVDAPKEVLELVHALQHHADLAVEDAALGEVKGLARVGGGLPGGGSARRRRRSQARRRRPGRGVEGHALRVHPGGALARGGGVLGGWGGLALGHGRALDARHLHADVGEVREQHHLQVAAAVELLHDGRDRLALAHGLEEGHGIEALGDVPD
mmetsp:Transcript_573/g.1811  ORF Transcript_573/g.1811 Transcript_573/m.1811 type:complete len:797 (-) Transcript_573:531-2921(-)